MGEYRLFGYSFEQWAIILGAFPVASVSYQNALQSRKRWISARSYDPGSEKISEPDKDYVAATELLALPLRA